MPKWRFSRGRHPSAGGRLWPFIGGTLITFAGAFAVSRSLFRNDVAASIMHGYAAIFAVLLMLAFGEQGTIPASTTALCQLVMIAVIIAGGDVCLHRSAASDRVVRDITGSLIRNPFSSPP